jgi:hypothetical protein
VAHRRQDGQETFKIFGLEFLELAGGELKSVVMGIERCDTFPEKPSDAHIEDFGELCQFLGCYRAISHLDVGYGGTPEVEHLGDLSLGETCHASRLAYAGRDDLPPFFMSDHQGFPSLK